MSSLPASFLWGMPKWKFATDFASGDVRNFAVRGEERREASGIVAEELRRRVGVGGAAGARRIHRRVERQSVVRLLGPVAYGKTFIESPPLAWSR